MEELLTHPYPSQERELPWNIITLPRLPPPRERPTRPEPVPDPPLPTRELEKFVEALTEEELRARFEREKARGRTIFHPFELPPELRQNPFGSRTPS